MAEPKTFTINGVRVEVREAPSLRFPSGTDSNSPIWWVNDTMYILNSTGHSTRSWGKNVETLQRGGEITYTAWRDGGRWIESVHQEADGMLYGWYHNEPAHLFPDSYHVGRQFPLTAPLIGAVASYDNGDTWDDLGLVLTSPPDQLNLEAHNFWFAGGNGDFSVILDRKKEYFYFLFGTYYKDVSQQGISIARMRYEDRGCPVGKVWKWHEGAWEQPGLRGKVTPVIPVSADWYDPAAPDTFWGPSVHWNTAINQFVILMNRAIDPRWKQDGIYISFTKNLGDPNSWTEPVKILEETGWYPQVVGDAGKCETEREAGSDLRVFIHGESKYTIRFERV